MAGFDFASYVVGYVAGMLSTLSPCVLPLLPILVASALAEHRYGPLVLALGLTLSFTSVGLLTATIGIALGLDAQLMRVLAAVALLVFGAMLVVPRLRDGFERVSARLGRSGDAALERLHALHVAGWPGQFAIGALLGLVWTPCVGPTLGAATTLAVQGTELPSVALVLLVFGLGASTPLVLLGGLSKATLGRWRARLLEAGGTGRRVLGVLMLAVGVLVLTGLDKRAESFVLQVTPDWLSRLATRY